MESSLDILVRNARPSRPRRQGITEIRGPYYTPLGRHALEDVLGGDHSQIVQLECLRQGIWPPPAYGGG